MKKEGRKPLVLVADDVEACQADIAYVVEGLGARVCFAKNVKGALLKAAMHGPLSDDPLNLVIVDMHMPFDETQTAIDKEAGIRVLNSYRLVTCPVVVFTAYPSYSTCVKAIKLGAYAYVTKNENEILGGKEGGPGEFKQLCQRLLFHPEEVEERGPPTDNWLSNNYTWLCDTFYGNWVAFVNESTARNAGLNDDSYVLRDGLGILAGSSYEDVRNLVIGSFQLIREFPTIVLVPTKNEEAIVTDSEEV